MALPAAAQRHSAHGKADSGSYGMGWSVTGGFVFPKPTAAPGLRTPSVDGDLIACTTGKPVSAGGPGLDILYKFRGGASGLWGGAGDQCEPAVADGFIAGLVRDGGDSIATFDPAKQTAVQVSDAAAVSPSSPAFDGSTVAWVDHRNGNADIYARSFDTATGQPVGDAFPVCTAAGDQIDPAVSGDSVVWQDARSGHDHIYACSLTTMSEIPVCTAPGDQRAPDVDGQTVVWQDSRGGQWDIYSYGLGTKAEKPICTARSRQVRPAVSGDLVVWQDYQPLYVQEDQGPTFRWAGHSSLPTASLQASPWSSCGGRHKGQTNWRPAVSDGTVVWEHTVPGLPAGATRIFMGRVHDMWAYGYTRTPDREYINVPALTFSFEIALCPHPPVTEVGVSFGRNDWQEEYTWFPFAPQVSVPIPGGDGRKSYMVTLRDSTSREPGASGSDFILDTHGPSCWAPSPVSGRQGGTAVLPYRVTDKLSPQARATVTILHEDGTVARILGTRLVPTGAVLTRTIDCDLIPGTYTLQVTAKDLAGNQQVRTGTTTLTVR